jgi:leader peptidase (prepilin peptidase)/N-methyltransferase
VNDVAGAATAAACAALLCAVGGLLVPRLIDRLPEPPPADAAGEGDTGDVQEEPKEPYAAIAATRGLAWRCATAAAVAGGLVGAGTGWAWALLFLVPLVPVGVALAVVDLRTKLLPTRIVRPAHAAVLVLAGAAAALDTDGRAYVRALAAMLVVRSVFWLLWWIRSAGMGFGDVRLSALLGFALGYLGWGEVVVGTYSGFLVFGLPGLLVALVRRDRAFLRTAFPFGPFMLAGALLGVVAGPWIWSHLATGGA